MSGNIVPFRPSRLPPEILAAADAARLALRTFKASPELDRAIERLRIEIEGNHYRHQLVGRTDNARRWAFRAGLDGKLFVRGADSDAFLRGQVQRARLQGYPLVTMMPGRWPWTR